MREAEIIYLPLMPPLLLVSGQLLVEAVLHMIIINHNLSPIVTFKVSNMSGSKIEVVVLLLGIIRLIQDKGYLLL